VRLAAFATLVLVFDGAVMLEDKLIAQNLAKDGRGLVGDRGEGNGVDDPPKIGCIPTREREVPRDF